MTQFSFVNQFNGNVNSLPIECETFTSHWITEIDNGERINCAELERLKSTFSNSSINPPFRSPSENWLQHWILWKAKLHFLKVQFMLTYAMVLAMNHVSPPNQEWNQVATEFLNLLKTQVKNYSGLFEWVEYGYWIIMLGESNQKELQAWIDRWQMEKEKWISALNLNLDQILNLPKTENKLEFNEVCPARIGSILNQKCNMFGFSISIDWNTDNSIKQINVTRSVLLNNLKLTNELNNELKAMGWHIQNS